MARTAAADVKLISDTALSDSDISKIIDSANFITTETLEDEGLSDGLLKEIETYLTAHIIAIGRERQTAEERVHDIWVVHQGHFSTGLYSTTFGQYVLFLDTSGKFAQRNKKKMTFTAIPQDPDSDTHNY